jgi:hypothetical protein
MNEQQPKQYREKDWWEYYPLHKIWCNDICPLFPRFYYYKGDELNANRWCLHWLFFTIWTMESFSFGIDAEISPSGGVWAGLILPYLRITVGIRHIHFDWQWKLDRWLRLKPAKKNENGEYN